MVMNKNKECAFCGEEFTPKRSDTKFCSESCKQRAYLSRKQAEVEDMQSQLWNNNRQTTDNDDYSDDSIIDEQVADRRQLTDGVTRKMMDNSVTDSREMTDVLRVKTTDQPKRFTDARSHFTDKRYDDDPHRMIEVTINGKKITMMKSTYQMLDDDELKRGEFYDSEEEHAEAERKESLQKAKQLWTYYEKDKVTNTNRQLAIWIRTLGVFKRGARLREIKSFVSRVTEFMKSSDYEYLPKGYEHKDFIENSLVPRIKRLIANMEVEGSKETMLVIDETYQEQLAKVLLDITT
jgi:hypothetical protein